jgi:hypothetical protein
MRFQILLGSGAWRFWSVRQSITCAPLNLMSGFVQRPQSPVKCDCSSQQAQTIGTFNLKLIHVSELSFLVINS